jgi:hypothetical protein
MIFRMMQKEQCLNLCSRRVATKVARIYQRQLSSGSSDLQEVANDIDANFDVAVGLLLALASH